jgi:hypothetical protein
LKFTSGELERESAEEALSQTLPFLTEKLVGKTTSVVDDIIEIAEIPERDIGADKATLANCMGYVAEGLDVATIIARKPRHEILAEIEVLREAKKVVETERFSALSFTDPKNFPKMKGDKAAMVLKNAGKAAKAPASVVAVAAPLTPKVAGGAAGGAVKARKAPSESPDQLKARLLSEIDAINANLATRDITVDPFKTNSEDIANIKAAITKIDHPGPKDVAPLAMQERIIKATKKALGL